MVPETDHSSVTKPSRCAESTASVRLLTLSAEIHDSTQSRDDDGQQNQKNYEVIMQIRSTLTVKSSLVVSVEN